MAHKDPITESLRLDLLKRDKGCVGPSVGMTGECGSQFGPGKITLEVDHVSTSGLGKRGPSSRANCVILCGLHHRVKTESSKKWRAALREYLIGVEGEAYG